jgi:hypothetical protein
LRRTVVYRHAPPRLLDVTLFLDICTGLGLAAAAGIRPFFPALIAGLLALANWSVDFEGTSYVFLESPVWLGAVGALMVLSFVLRRTGSGPTDAALGGMGIGLAAVLFAATLADHGRDSLGWAILGLAAGAAAATLGQLAYRDLLARTSQRLDEHARNALPLWFDSVAGLLAALSVALPPVSIVAVGFLVWLLLGGRKRAQGKYAGLRSLSK